MLDKQLESFRAELEKCIPLTIFIYNDKIDGGFCGITDAYDNYGYIRGKGGAKQYTYSASTFGCDYEKVTGSFRLIVDINKKIDLDEAHRLISHKLLECAADCGLVIKKSSSGSDKDDIWRQETGSREGSKDCKNNLLCFEFTITDDCMCNCSSVGCLDDLMD